MNEYTQEQLDRAAQALFEEWDDPNCEMGPWEEVSETLKAGYRRGAKSILDALNSGIAPNQQKIVEEAEEKWPVLVSACTDSDGTLFTYECDDNRRLREAYVDGYTRAFSTKHLGKNND